MRCSNRGESRYGFLREASTAILQFTGAGKLDIWLEDDGACYHWLASEKPEPKFALSKLPAVSVEGQPPSPNHENPQSNFFYRVLSLTGNAGQRSTETGSGPHEVIWRKESVFIHFEIDSRNEGVLRLTGQILDASIDSQVEVYEGLAQLLGIAISNRRARSALLERVKELTCMYRIAHIAAESSLDLGDMLQEVVDLLPVAMQYPDLATARITIGQNVFRSAGFDTGPHRLSTQVTGRGEIRGEVEVFYRQTGLHGFEDINFPMEEPFLAEERHLIVGVARELNSIIERKLAEEERLQLQKQVRHADRLVTIGQLAAGVAHELNEPLGNILGFAQLASKSPNLSSQARSDIEKIEKASLYAREIIRKLMLFSRQTPSRKIDVSLKAVVEDSLSLIESRCDAAGVKVVKDLGSELPLIHGDPSQLQQVFVNLAVNAIQSMSDGGTLTISIQQAQDQQCVTVSDTGSGIAAGDIKNIFLPFFTTKDVGEGTGLGLSVAHGIISSHGGSVHVESTPGSGSQFEVRLPTKQSRTSKTDSDE